MDIIEKEYIEKLVQERTYELTQINSELSNYHEQLVELVEQRTRDLVRSLEQLESISSNIPDCVIHSIEYDTITGKANFIYLDKKWEKMFGLSHEDSILDFWKTMKSIAHPDDFQFAVDKIKDSVTNYTKATFEIRYKTAQKNGWLRILAMPRNEGTTTIVEGIFIDNTYQKELELGLLSKTQQLETIASNLPDTALFQLVREVATGKLHMSYTSEGWKKITGIDPDLLKDDLHPLLSAINAEDLQNLLEAMTSTAIKLNTDYCADVRFRNNVKKGWFTIALRSSRIEDKIVWDGIIRDTTDRKTYELELAIHNESLEDIIKQRIEELQAAYEEIRISNNELQTNKTELTQIIEDKTLELNKNKVFLTSMSLRKKTISKILKIMQTEEEIDRAINYSMAEMGRYFNLSDIKIFKKNDDLKSIECQYSWRNPLTTNSIQKLEYQNIQFSQEDIDKLFAKRVSIISNVYDKECEMSVKIVNFFTEQGIQSFILTSLTENDTNDCIILFGECAYRRIWESADINLTKIFAGILHISIKHQQAEKKSRKAKQKTEEATRLKSTFLVNMSNEIRMPLKEITETLSILAADNTIPKHVHKQIEKISKNNEDLRRMINDMSDAAVMEAGQMLLCPVLIDISVLLSELYDKFNKQVKQTKQDNVLLEYIVNETDNKEIVIDPMRVRQILENLIGNAIKFTNKGHVRFGFNRIDGNKMQIFVEDTGIGIDEDAQNIIFEKFRQVEIGAVRRFSETGLGLSVSRRLARFMDGDITLKSKVGEGTTFYFTIPCG